MALSVETGSIATKVKFCKRTKIRIYTKGEENSTMRLDRRKVSNSFSNIIIISQFPLTHHCFLLFLARAIYFHSSFLSIENWSWKRVVKVKCDYYWVLLWYESTPCHILISLPLFFKYLAIISIYISTFFIEFFIYLSRIYIFIDKFMLSSAYICWAHITCRRTS